MPQPITFDGPRLLVDGTPFLVVGAELHNSSASSLPAIERSFTRTAELGATTLLAPVAWEQWEPSEGSYDTTLLDGMLETARRLSVRLILLWFGSWKNGMSSYVPAWVKVDTDRFPRAETKNGRVEVLSPFEVTSRDADARAFAALMAHLKEHDREQTVIMVQVENEVGLLGDSRDRSALADAAWSQPVPDEVVAAITEAMPAHQAWVSAGSKPSGTWAEVFGTGPAAEEAFMAAAYASYVEQVAAAGHGAYGGVPLFVNAWLAVPSMIGEIIDGMIAAKKAAGEDVDESQFATVKKQFAVEGGVQPGSYPSGGPVSRVAPIWRALAPTLSLLAPDVYYKDVESVCQEYKAASGRLFIPECRRSAEGVAGMYRAIGLHGAIGACPFGIDSLSPESGDYEVVTDAFTQLRAVAGVVAASGASPVGFVVTAEQPTATVTFGKWTMHVDTRSMGLSAPTYPAYGLVVPLGDDEALIVGRAYSPTFSHADGGIPGLVSVDELEGDGSVRRRLNGDETASGSRITFYALGAKPAPFMPIPHPQESTGIYRVRLYTY
ncbi:MAG TPA: DUF5597 domain-containing protein [Propionibacteriaceae bacterium]|nr:DUF5597 domain-containing protein [Propionibacteriaceae bacterium]